MKRFGKKLVMVLAVLMCGVIAFAGAACQRGGGKDTIAVIAKGETHLAGGQVRRYGGGGGIRL